jgi:adenylate cyclase
MSAHNEIERKFLLEKVPDGLDQWPHVEIAQGYLANDSQAEARLRQMGKDRLITVKIFRADFRIETEVALSEEQFSQLWPATEGRRLRKIRYRIPYEAHTIEVNVYQGKNAGLMVAEIEFPDQNSRQQFKKTEWLGAEISGRKEFSNQALATE